MMLGHASVATTEIYTHVEINDLARVLRRYHPRERNWKNELDRVLGALLWPTDGGSNSQKSLQARCATTWSTSADSTKCRRPLVQ